MLVKKKNQIDKKWVFREKKKFFKSSEILPEIIEILSARGIETEKDALEFLNPQYEMLADPFLLKDMDKAVDAVTTAVKNKEKITIYGDYDVDGITATTLLIDFFQKIGVDADYYIPSRHSEGYGLNVEAIENLAEKGTQLLITVDCGSTSIEEIKRANELGMKVVVTDHHSLQQVEGKELLPEAVAVINPRRSDSKYSQYLAGVGVAFYLARAVQTRFLDIYSLGQEKWLLDLVALGTVCDVVPLVDDNRVLVSYGLKVLAKTKRIGLKQLAKVIDFKLEEIQPYHLGFLIGPRLNAAGRLETAENAIKLLVSNDALEAEKLARELDTVNKERQELTEKILNEAREIIQNDKRETKIHLLANEKWPSGVVGIVASRLVDEFGKPVLVMEDKGEELKGSARSISCFNIVEALGQCSEHLGHFGGHAYAAGFTLPKVNFVLLEDKLIKISNEKITEEDLVREVVIDAEVDITNINFELFDQLKRLEPFGPANPKPIFVLNNLEVVDMRLVGNPANHLKLSLAKNEYVISGMFFNFGEQVGFEIGDNLSVLVTLDENIWKGNRKIEFRGIDLILNK